MAVHNPELDADQGKSGRAKLYALFLEGGLEVTCKVSRLVTGSECG